MSLAIINAVWVGPTLGPVHAACLASFVRHGHKVRLHCYERPEDLPTGVEAVDASSILPASRIVRYRAGGSLALFANLFRYELLAAGAGLYVDCDVYCLKPMEDSDYIFGWENSSAINNAVLKLPPESPALAGLRELKDARALIPPWASKKRQMYYRLRAMMGIPVSISDMPWGTTGPSALTWHLKRHGLERYAAPQDTFYWVNERTAALLDPDLTIDELTTHRTTLLHLYNETLRHVIGRNGIPPSSPLGQLLDR